MNVAPLIKEMVVNAGFQAVDEEIYKVCAFPSYDVTVTYKPAVSPLTLAQGQAAERAGHVHELESVRGRSSLQFGAVHSHPWLGKRRSRGADGWSSKRSQQHKISSVHPPVSHEYFLISFSDKLADLLAQGISYSEEKRHNPCCYVCMMEGKRREY